jgi:3-hydroxyacyl-CoA dehydrogenase
MGAAGSRAADPDELGDRLTLVAALEAVRCLQDEVILDPRDGDVAGVLGIGYPAQRGGPFRHLAARGLAAIRSRLAALEDRFGSQFAAPPLLVELARTGSDFSAMEGRRL